MSSTPANNNASSDDSVIRIRAERVSRIMDMVGELSLIANHVTHHPELAEMELEGFENSAYRLTQVIKELQDETSGLRLVPISGVFRRMQRLVRDLAKNTDKPIQFQMVGEDTEIDKVVVDTLSEPLIHIIRNSVDHGIEEKQDRIAKDKPEKGFLELKATQEGSDIVISIRDDGNGLNRDRILDKAIGNGLIQTSEGLTDQEIWNLIFEPGFSTKEQVSNLSGRGVGMDVVKTAITSLRGQIDIENRPGKGVTIRLIIPLNLAFLDTLVVSVQNHLFAINVESVQEVLHLDKDELTHCFLDNSDTLKIRGELVPVFSLSEYYESGERSLNDNPIMLVVNSRSRKLAIPVDEVHGQFQVTVKPMKGSLKQIRAASGCAILPNGDVALVLDCLQLNDH